MTITLAIPSKGRLKDQSLETLPRDGLAVGLSGDDRKYRARIEGRDDIEVAFLSASEIAGEIGQGNVDLGITGEDLLRENVADWERKAAIEARLGFGPADVVVAVPESWLDVDTMADLDDVAAEFRQRHGRRLRIATKYWRLTQQLFSLKHCIQVYRIVESLGATEGAPAAGLADIIVDITTTGSTLRANHLKVLGDGVILKSQACLVASKKARDAADEVLLKRIAAKLPPSCGEGASRSEAGGVAARRALPQGPLPSIRLRRLATLPSRGRGTFGGFAPAPRAGRLGHPGRRRRW